MLEVSVICSQTPSTHPPPSISLRPGGKARRKATHTRARRNMCGSRPAAGSRQASPQLPPAAQTGIGSPPAAATPDCNLCSARASDGRTNSRRTHAKSRPGLTHSSRSAQTNRDSCHECELPRMRVASEQLWRRRLTDDDGPLRHDGRDVFPALCNAVATPEVRRRHNTPI